MIKSTLHMEQGNRVAVNNHTLSPSYLLTFLTIALLVLLPFLSIPAHAAFGDFLYKWGAEYDCQQVYGIAVDVNGNVYVADTYNHRVQVFSNTGSFLRKWGTYGSGDGQFSYPYGLAVDGTGNVHVLDTMNSRVQVFSSTGTFIRKWGTYGSGDGQFSYPAGIAVDGSGNVYVADTYNYRIQVFNNTGTFLRKWGTSGSGDGQFSYPAGIAVDGSGNVYVVEIENHRIQVFNSTGVFLRKWGSSGSGDGQFSYPRGIAVDGSGNVFVADTNNRRVQVFNSTGTFLRKWETGWIIRNNDPNSFPVCLSVDSVGHVFVSDPYNDTIFVFDSSGTFITNWVAYGSGDGQFSGPWGIALDSNGNVYVADTGNRRVQVFSNTGIFLRKWGSRGSNDGQFGGYAQGIAVDNSDNVYVTDMDNNRIQVFSNTGTFIRKWGTYGSGDGQFYTPFGIAVDNSGNVYVADANNDRVQVFSNTGAFIRKWGSRGFGDGQFRYPAGIAVDGSGNVFVTDVGNSRVQVFSSTGTFLRKFGAPFNSDGRFYAPYGITVDVNGNVYVGDASYIYVFSNTGTFLGIIGTSGWAGGLLNSPYSLAVDVNAHVFEADYYNHRIQVFDGRITDTQPPATTSVVSGILGNNEWHVSDVLVSLSASDNQGGSGVKEVHYSIDGSAESIVAGTSASVTITTEGTHTLTYYAKDNAGNEETPHHDVTIKIDKTPPTITGSATPAANASGWNNTDVTVTFSCTDAISGIAACTSPITVTTEGAGQVITGTAEDYAGKTATATVTLNIDKTLPTITAHINPAPNVSGWHNTDVTVTFTCSDTLSDIASCPAPVTVTTEGAGQVISGTAVDNAGNTATASVTLNIDKMPPVLSVSASPGMLWPPNHKYVIVTPSITVTDANPGTTVKLVSVTSSEPDNGLGDGDTANDIVINADGTISLRAERSGNGSGRVYTITYEATDIAENATTSSATVTVPHDMR